MANRKLSKNLSEENSLSRRLFLSYFSGIGMASSLLPGILFVKCQGKTDKKITKKMLRESEQLAGLEFTDEERELMIDGLNSQLEKYQELRNIPLGNSVPPALQFNPVVPGMKFEKKSDRIKMSDVQISQVPSNLEELAFLPVIHLAKLIKSRKVSSVELTNMYLSRLKRYSPKLQCVVTLTEELAIKQAERADKEIAKGRYHGPLHGIPCGIKDLFSTKGYKTTWGAIPYKDQIIDEDATVVVRLEEAGAVLAAKLTLGALAMGDVWYAGKTRTPWDTEVGSSGSSAGPGAATAAGLVGFSIGTETNGSIVSPSVRCGITGLRPTFGRVSRYGAMALSWSMDKIGPLCRTVEDCALVLNAIYGPDGKDLTTADVPFNWDCNLNIRNLRIGYVESAFEKERDDKEGKANDEATLEKLRSLGFKLIPIELPNYPIGTMNFISDVEAAAAFDELTRSNRDDLLVRQAKGAWPNTFRRARLAPAVEYIQANRLRTLVMKAMADLMSDIDAYVVPAHGNENPTLTNLTGNPAVAVPNGFNKKGLPTGITFIGKLYGEAELLALAKLYQDSTNFHLKHPAL